MQKQAPTQALSAELLTPDALRRHFAASPPPPPLPLENRTPAAVLVPIVLRPHGLTLLLTQRTAHLRDHAGQVSFPGGRTEAEDADAIATALREAEEEVGIAPAQVEVLGTLPDYDTGSGFQVTPVVALVHPPLNLKLDDFEVADVFEPPLAWLLDPANHQRHRLESPEKRREFWAMPWQGYYVWGATASMIVSLGRALNCKP